MQIRVKTAREEMSNIGDFDYGESAKRRSHSLVTSSCSMCICAVIVHLFTYADAIIFFFK